MQTHFDFAKKILYSSSPAISDREGEHFIVAVGVSIVDAAAAFFDAIVVVAAAVANNKTR